jgi:hypothetical protein
VRAFDPWPVAEGLLDGERVRIWSALALDARSEAAPGSIVAVSADGIDVAAGDGVLRIRELQRRRPPHQRARLAQRAPRAGAAMTRPVKPLRGKPAPTLPGVALRAARALARIAFDGVSLRVALASAHARLPDSRDRALLAASVFAASRWWLRLSAALDRLMEKPLPTRAREIRAARPRLRADRRARHARLRRRCRERRSRARARPAAVRRPRQRGVAPLRARTFIARGCARRRSGDALCASALAHRRDRARLA